MCQTTDMLTDIFVTEHTSVLEPNDNVITRKNQCAAMHTNVQEAYIQKDQVSPCTDVSNKTTLLIPTINDKEIWVSAIMVMFIRRSPSCIFIIVIT